MLKLAIATQTEREKTTQRQRDRRRRSTKRMRRVSKSTHFQCTTHATHAHKVWSSVDTSDSLKGSKTQIHTGSASIHLCLDAPMLHIATKMPSSLPSTLYVCVKTASAVCLCLCLCLFSLSLSRSTRIAVFLFDTKE